jgi:hypothetical protein
MREREARVVRVQLPTRGDKAVRAQSIRGRMELDGLYVPTQAQWYPAFLSELLNLPAGKHDDQVDALGLIGQLLDRMTSGRKPKKNPELKRDAYRELHEQFSDDAIAPASSTSVCRFQQPQSRSRTAAPETTREASHGFR